MEVYNFKNIIRLWRLPGNRLDRLSTKRLLEMSSGFAVSALRNGAKISVNRCATAILAALLTACSGSTSAQVSLVHSRADLLRGLQLDRFYSFDGPSSDWEGGEFVSGFLKIDSPFGGGTRIAANRWSPGERFAIEFESRFGGGPVDSEFGLILDYRQGREGIRVRFRSNGNVLVELFRPGSQGEPIAEWKGGTRYRAEGWNRLAVRGDRRRLSIVVGGEEILVVELPFVEEGGIALYGSAGARYDFDHVALFSRAVLPAANGKRGNGGASGVRRAVYFDSFEAGRGEWRHEYYPVRDGVLKVVPVEGRPSYDILTRWRFAPERLEAEILPEPGSSLSILLDARPVEADFEGWFWEIDQAGASRLYFRKGGEDRLAAGPVAVPGWAEHRRVKMVLTGGDSLYFSVQGKTLFTMPPGTIQPGWVGVGVREGSGFSLDQLLFTLPEREEEPDREEAVFFWDYATRLREEGAAATAIDRLRELSLRHPYLPGLSDLIYREAVRAGSPGVALAVAGAMRVAGEGPASEVEQLRIMAMLLAGRHDEAYGILQRYRAEWQDHPFGLENSLMLLDRSGQYERLLVEYDAARAGSGPVRATSHGVAAWAYLQLGIPERAVETVRSGLRLGPGRLDLVATEGEILWARGDVGGAKVRFARLLESSVSPFAEEDLLARIGLLHFEIGEYADAARVLGQLSGGADPEVERARSILRAIALFRHGEQLGEAGRLILDNALVMATDGLKANRSAGDAILYDLAGRVKTALAVLDLSAGESYSLYRSKRAAAMEDFRRAASLDPSFQAIPAAGEEVPAIDPARFRSLIEWARPHDHPVGGFVENRNRWYSWYVVERRADLAERAINAMLTDEDGATP